MYQALYRKQRPKNFEEIIGQEHIVKTLKNQIQNERVSHAYLFCGTRGTGKTSCSLVFSKAINCLSPINNEPCNNCDSCNQINNSNSMDVYEIDAASNNGVDNIREIVDEINYPPTISKYKIYIIDEVHMLSTGAFNALLKTLEEPPSHAIFILATTDPQKLPQTILSRCQRYDFKRIKAFDMKKSLQEVCVREKRVVEDRAIEYICQLSDGAMRDALSLLDQSFSYFFEGDITIDNVLEIVGSVDKKVFFEFTDALITFDSITLINVIDSLVMSSSDIIQFVTEEIKHLRDILVANSNAIVSLNYSDEHINKIKEQSQKVELSQIIVFIEEFSKLLNELKSSKNQRILLETSVLKLCNAIVLDNEKDGLILRIKKLENTLQKFENGSFVQNNVPKEAEVEDLQKAQVIIEKAIPKDIEMVKNDWSTIISKLEQFDHIYFKNNVKVGYIESDVLYLVCSTNADFFMKRQDALDDILKKLYNKEFNIKFIEVVDYDLLHKKKYSVSGEYSNSNSGIYETFKEKGVELQEEDF